MPLIENDMNGRHFAACVRTEDVVAMGGRDSWEPNLVVHRKRGQDLDLILNSLNALNRLHFVFCVQL
jgi:hypothetical protein